MTNVFVVFLSNESILGSNKLWIYLIISPYLERVEVWVTLYGFNGVFGCIGGS